MSEIRQAPEASTLAPTGAGSAVAPIRLGQKLRWTDLASTPPADAAAAKRITAEQASRLRAVPFAIERSESGAERLHVAMVDPADAAAADEISVSSGLPVRRFKLEAGPLSDLLRASYGATAAAMVERLRGEGQDDDLLANVQAVDAQDIHRMAEEPTVINLVNLIILEAVRSRASDVHVEPFDKSLSVKYRVDGLLKAQTSPPKALQSAITSRIKIMGGMDIAERYVPQDGHITLRFEGRKVDIRVSTVPTIYGESVVMRLLDKQSIALDLTSLGMSAEQRREMDRLIDLPHGMLLVTGPTGSGKTTTLYAALSKLYDPSLKIITIEDPVEYELSGINQIPVNPERGLMFATGLRAILRQDPDVVMVGEIRDAETAEIAVRAALTGHLILSTLHTNDAASAIGRLLDMSIEPFLLSSVLEAVLAQRLGRRVCPHCGGSGAGGSGGKRVVVPEASVHRLQEVERAMFSRDASGRLLQTVGSGCDKCDNTGFRGRLGFYELLTLNSEMRAAITSGKTSTPELLKTAPPGYITMRRDGLSKAAAGMTTVDEVLRATQDVGE
jgi:type II secretory ATPase GspE/PulE/Tfp pilus assembly ATPase PilB-like protein